MESGKIIAVRGLQSSLASHQSSDSRTADTLFTAPDAQPSGSTSPRHEQSSVFAESLPCVLYECNAAFEFTYVSENVYELLNLSLTDLIGHRLVSDERIPSEDAILLSKRLAELEHFDKRTSLVHRILDRRGLPLWVAHSLWKAYLNDATVVRGCILPLDYTVRLNISEQSVISRFVHKIGNHFQLLNLVVNSLKRTIPDSKEMLMLQETVEKSIDLTRGFSDYHQIPEGLSRIALVEILQASVVTRRSSFENKGITFDNPIDASINDATVWADAYLLELAIGHLLDNALEATEAGGQVTLHARLKYVGDNAPTAIISIMDSGCGIDNNALTDVVAPFFSTKKNHDGLGLSMASRLIEIHGGILRITSAQGKGTRVEIVLPIEAERRSCLF